MKTTEEMIEVMQHYANGGSISVTGYSNKYSSPRCNFPVWDWCNNDYNIVKTPPSVDWSVIKPEYQWLAVDECGAIWVYTHKPIKHDAIWSSTWGEGCCVSSLVSTNRGEVSWEDSLVKRPDGV